MKIRLIENRDQEQVQDIMREYPIPFPKFIIEKYPKRWTDFMKSYLIFMGLQKLHRQG